jgi:peroxiredoxin
MTPGGELTVTGYAVWALRLTISAIFVVAAIGKLADRAAVGQVLREFGVPARFTVLGSRALPVAELVVAVAVLPPFCAVAGCCAALALLAVFTTAVASQLRQGRHPRCSCFGTVSATPVSGWTLVRNAVIALLTAAALAGSLGWPGVPAALPPVRVIGIAVVIALAAAQWRQTAGMRALRAEVALLRANQPRHGGLTAGTAAPDFELPDTQGRTTGLHALRDAGRPVVLLFMHPTCAACQQLAGEFSYWQARSHDRLTLAPISGGDPAASAEWAAAFGLDGLLVQHRAEIAGRYRLHSTPSAVLIDTEGRIAGPAARGVQDIRDLLTDALDTTPATPDTREHVL